MAKTKEGQAAEQPRMPKPLSDEGTVEAHRKDVKEVAAKLAKSPLFREDDGRAEDMKKVIGEMSERIDSLRMRAQKASRSDDYEERQKFIDEMLGNIDAELASSGKKMNEGKIEDALFSLRVFGYTISAVDGLEKRAMLLQQKPELTDGESRVLGSILATVRGIEYESSPHRLVPLD